MKFIGLMSCILMLTFNHAFTQDIKMSEDFNLQTSEPFNGVDADYKFYTKNSKYVMSLKIVKDNKIVIQSFDPDILTELSRSEHKLEKIAHIETIISTNTGFYLVYDLYDKRAEISHIFAQEIDPTTSKFIGEAKKLFDVEGRYLNNFNRRWALIKRSIFGFEKSKSENKVFIHFRMAPENGDQVVSKGRIGLYVFDSEMNKLWGDIHSVKYTDVQMRVEDYAVSNDGNAYVLCKIFMDRTLEQRKRGDRDLDSKYELIQFSDGSETGVYHPIELDDNKIIQDASIREHDENRFIVAGYYNYAPYPAYVEGGFVISIDKRTAEQSKIVYEIPLDIIHAYEAERDGKNKVRNKKADKEEVDESAGLSNLEITDVLIDDDGNMIIIGEQFWIAEEIVLRESPNGMQSGYPETAYYFGDILVTKLTSDGKPAWMIKIPRLQKGTSSRTIDKYYKMITDEYLYIIYLDNKTNDNLTIDEDPQIYFDGRYEYLTSSRINYQSGEVSKENVFDLEEINGTKLYQFAAGRILNLSKNEIAIEFYKRKDEDIWIKVGLN